MKTSDPTQTIAKLRNSKVFKNYASAFEGATGIALSLQGDPEVAGDAEHRVAVKLGDSPVAFLQLEAAGEEISQGRFDSAMTIARTFACQLSEIADRILLEQQAAEPAAIVKAKRYIIEKLDEPLRLDEVAAQVQVSPFYFCKLFKGTTGMTFTEFVNRQRIERAKRRLLDPSERITEIAYGVGYQSLSQFNRSFHRIVGESPTQFRKRMGVGKSRFQLVA